MRVSDVFIDGYEIKVGSISKRAANRRIYVMKNEIQKKTKDMSIKNIFPWNAMESYSSGSPCIRAALP